jgi:hypothetical protein
MTDPGFVRLSDWLVRLSDVRFWTAAKLTHLNRNSVIVFINKLTEPPVGGSEPFLGRGCHLECYCLVAVAYAGSNPAVEVKLLRVPKTCLCACLRKPSASGLPIPVLLCAASETARN